MRIRVRGRSNRKTVLSRKAFLNWLGSRTSRLASAIEVLSQAGRILFPKHTRFISAIPWFSRWPDAINP